MLACIKKGLSTTKFCAPNYADCSYFPCNKHTHNTEWEVHINGTASANKMF